MNTKNTSAEKINSLPILCECYFMTKDYSSTASGPPSLTREGLSISFVLQMIY